MSHGNEIVYSEVRRRMVESGEWDRITTALTKKLNETGWIDEMRDRSKETMRNADPLRSVQDLMDELRPEVESSVAPIVRQEISAMIRHYLDTQLEK